MYPQVEIKNRSVENDEQTVLLSLPVNLMDYDKFFLYPNMIKLTPHFYLVVSVIITETALKHLLLPLLHFI